MLTEPQKKWVAALRSGEFKQGKHALQDGDCYCCLGVACVVYEREVEKLPNGIRGLILDDEREAVREWLGLECDAGQYSKAAPALTEHNDGGMTFAEIADLIESEPEGLFVKQ